ncbi:MAG: hypothetical protein ACP5RR_09615 [Candidatus Kapaibacteriota bacterium]|jgi:hypothetical protein
MVYLFIILFFLTKNFSLSEVTDSSAPIAKVLVYSFREERPDDIISRKVYHQFKIYKNDTLLFSVGEMYDRPAEITIPFGKYKFKFYDSKEWKEAEIIIDTPNSVLDVQKLFKVNSKQKQ